MEIKDRKAEVYKILAESLINPEGIVELYHNCIGNEPYARVPALQTAIRDHPELQMDEKQRFNYGMAMRYLIAQQRIGPHLTTISLEFLATYGSSYPILYDERTKKQNCHSDPSYICDLATFDYSPGESLALGQQILAGEQAGPLAHELFQELQQKDPEFNAAKATRQKIGSYMVALGTLAQDIISAPRVWLGYNAKRIDEERRRKKEMELWHRAATETPRRDEDDDVPF